MPLVIAPIMEGKVEAWKAWAASLQDGELSDAFKDLNQRYELTRHDAWLVTTPNGMMVAVLQEGPGADTFIPKLAASNNPVDEEFKRRIEEYNGFDVSVPPPSPLPELLLSIKPQKQ